MQTSVNIFVLALKDIRLKIINLGSIWAFLVAGSLILSFFSEKTGQFPLFIFPALATCFLALFYMEWLISEERERGTFQLLRTMPISDPAIVSAKIITLGLLLLVHPIAILPSALVNPANLLAAAVTLLAALSVFCGCIWGTLLFLALRGANKYVIPLFAILLISLVALLIMQKFPGLPGFLMTLPTNIPGAILLSPLSALLGWWLACRYMQSRDSGDLAD